MSLKILHNYIQNFVPIVAQNIANVLPEKTSLILDGWTRSRSYVGIFVGFMNSGKYCEALILLAPLPEEDDLGAK